MVDRYLEPDEELFQHEILDEGTDEEPSAYDMDVAQFNYECLVYNEPERIIPWRR